MKDERIEQVNNKIRSEMAIIILCGVAISYLVKTLVFNMDLKEHIVESLILILAPIYQFIRMHMMKTSLSSDHGNKKSSKVLLIPFFIFLAASALSFFKQVKDPALYNWQSPVVLLSIYLVLLITISFMTNKYDQQRSRKYEKEFDDDSNL